MHLIVVWLLSFLRILIIRSDEAEYDKPGVVEHNEDRSKLKDAHPDVSNLLRDPLCVIEVCYFDAQVGQVDEAAREAQRINNSLFTRVRVQLIEVALTQQNALIL